MIYFCCKTNHTTTNSIFKMNVTILTLLASLFLLPKIYSQNPIDRSLLIVRNNYLRFYIYTKKYKIKSCLLTASTTIKDRTNIFSLRRPDGSSPSLRLENSLTLCSADASRPELFAIYNKVMSKYYDAQTAYYSLSQDDREIIEHVINMYF
jgi:hypothetical protein